MNDKINTYTLKMQSINYICKFVQHLVMLQLRSKEFSVQTISAAGQLHLFLRR